MNIQKIDGDFTVCKVKDFSQIKFDAEFCFFGKTDEEISLVCLTKECAAKHLKKRRRLARIPH